MKRIDVWLRSVGGSLRAGLRNDSGADGSSLAANPDGSSIGVVGNQIIRGAGALPAPGTSPKPTVPTPTAIAVELADPSGMLIVATDRDNKNKALALNPDWETVVVDDGVPSNFTVYPIQGPFYPSHVTGTFLRNRLTVLMPPALTRAMLAYAWDVGPNSFIHASDGTIDVPLFVPAGLGPGDFVSFFYDGREWVEAPTGEFGDSPSTIYIPEDGTYAWTVNPEYAVQWGGPPVDYWDAATPFHDSDGFDLQGLPVSVTLEIKVGGTVLVTLNDTFVSPQGWDASSWPGDGGTYQLTPSAFPSPASGETHLSRGDTLSATISCDSPAPQSRIWYNFTIHMFGIS